MKKPASHTPRSRKLLESYGCEVDRTEWWNPFAHKKRDLFNLFDLLAIDTRQDTIIGVQVTSRDHISHRRNKILASHQAFVWMKAGGYIHIHGWDKKGTSRKWECKIEIIKKEDINAYQINHKNAVIGVSSD